VGLYSGFSDTAHDADGNVFVVGTYPKSIVKIDAEGKSVEAWYPPPAEQPVIVNDATVRGFSGYRDCSRRRCRGE